MTKKSTETPEQSTDLSTLPDLHVSYTPAVIEVNFEQLEAALTAQVEEQSKTVITVDNLQDGKKLAASMKKTADAIKAARIDYARRAGVDIKTFEDRMKALEQIALDGRAKITEQNERFDNETRAKALQVLTGYLAQQFIEKAVQPEFQSGDVKPLVSLTALTGNGALTKASKAAVDAMVQNSLNLQNQTKLRLMELENASYRAGLAAPLNRGHVEMFLFADDAEYQQRLDALMQTELAREKQAQEAMRKKMEAEAMRVAEERRRAEEAERAAEEARQQRAQREAEHQQQLAAQAERNAAEQAALRERAEGNARPIFVRDKVEEFTQDVGSFHAPALEENSEQWPVGDQGMYHALAFEELPQDGGSFQFDAGFGDPLFNEQHQSTFKPEQTEPEIDPVIEHKRQVNRQIVDALAMIGIGEAVAVDIIRAAVKGQLGALRVHY